jgi:hypothetical protein
MGGMLAVQSPVAGGAGHDQQQFRETIIREATMTPATRRDHDE